MREWRSDPVLWHNGVMPDTARAAATNDIVPDNADVAIVGAGAAGLLFAARCAQAGHRVVVLESGPQWSLEDLRSSQIWARRLKWGGAPVLPGGDTPFGHAFGVGWGVGGSALHHYAGWPRLHPEDFRLRAQFGRGLDWPIDYETLRPWYDRVQREMGVSGDAAREPWRPPGTAYPMPPLRSYAHGELLAAGFRKLGMRVGPAPLAINSTVYRGRAACIDDGWCDAGCPIGALANPLVTHLPLAQKYGARIIANATVARVSLRTPARAAGLEWFDAAGVARRMQARIIVLAGGAIQNARLLLQSAAPGHASGLGNNGGLVGRYFQCHTIVTSYGLFAQPTEPYRGVNAGSLMSQDGYEKQRNGKPFGSYQWGIGQAIKPNDLLGIANTRVELFGERLHEFMRHAAQHIAMMSAVCETFPDADNRIELDVARDPYGLRIARLRHSLSADAAQLRAHVANEGLAVVRAAGAQQAWNGSNATAHALGGTIMGRSAADSVTDSRGRLHEVDNVFVAGGGLFPTIGASAPTFTIYALAARTAAHLLANFRDYAR